MNLYEFLENGQMRGLVDAYAGAYSGFTSTSKSLTSERYIGMLEDLPVLRARDGSLTRFAIDNAIYPSDNLESWWGASSKNSRFGKSLQTNYLQFLAYFLVNNHQQLPANRMKSVNFLNYAETHWVCVVADMQGLNLDQYQELYQLFQIYKDVHPLEHRVRDKDNNWDGESTATIEKQRAINFLTETLVLKKLDKELDFPMDFGTLELHYFDSMNSSAYRASTYEGYRHFIDRNPNKIKFIPHQATQQFGVTCGDHSVHNGFGYAIYGTTRQINYKNEKGEVFERTSQYLRLLSENISDKNAHEILFSDYPKLEEVPEYLKFKREEIVWLLRGAEMNPPPPPPSSDTNKKSEPSTNSNNQADKKSDVNQAPQNNGNQGLNKAIPDNIPSQKQPSQLPKILNPNDFETSNPSDEISDGVWIVGFIVGAIIFSLSFYFNPFTIIHPLFLNSFVNLFTASIMGMVAFAVTTIMIEPQSEEPNDFPPLPPTDLNNNNGNLNARNNEKTQTLDNNIRQQHQNGNDNQPLDNRTNVVVPQFNHVRNKENEGEKQQTVVTSAQAQVISNQNVDQGQQKNNRVEIKA